MRKVKVGRGIRKRERERYKRGRERERERKKTTVIYKYLYFHVNLLTYQILFYSFFNFLILFQIFINDNLKIFLKDKKMFYQCVVKSEK